MKEGDDMSLRMKWTKECRVGINDIDSQHRLLFAISNELLDFQNPVEEGPEFKYLFDHLRKYVAEHFAFEKQFMEEIQYPYIAEHLQKHDEIVTEINTVLQASTDFDNLKTSLEGLLTKWIKEHIMIEDKKYSEWHLIRKKQ